MACALLCGLAFALPLTARADDGDAPKPAPRTAITIGGASIVLVAAADHLYAFIDAVEDNAPVADAQLDVMSADGTAIEFSRTADGMFAAPFNRAGHMHDAFMVTLRSALGAGDAPAEIGYDDLPDSAAGGAPTDLKTKLSIALVAGGIGAITSAMTMLWLRSSRRRGAVPSVGSASVG